MKLVLMSRLGFGMAVAGIAWMALGRNLLGDGPVSIGFQVAAVLLMIWARVTFGWRSFHADASPTVGGLVTHGPYRYWRHPIYAAVLYFVWAGASAHSSKIAWAGALLVTLGLLTRMFAEEKLLEPVYPEYRDYAAHTKRVIPFIL